MRAVNTAILLLCTFYSKFLLGLRPISLEEKRETFIAAVKKKKRNASGHEDKNERQRKKANRNTRLFKKSLTIFFSRLVIPF